MVLAGSVHGKGVKVDEENEGSGSCDVCRGRVLEKEAQTQVQARVQGEPSCGSYSKRPTGFSSNLAVNGPVLEVTDGVDCIGNRSLGAGKVVKWGGFGLGPEDLKDGPGFGETQFRSGLKEVSNKVAFDEAQMQRLVREFWPIMLMGWQLGCEERPFYIKGSFVGWKDMTELGFRKGFEGLKGLRVHSHSKGAGMEDEASDEVSRALAREDARVVCFLGGD